MLKIGEQAFPACGSGTGRQSVDWTDQHWINRQDGGSGLLPGQALISGAGYVRLDV